MKVSTCRPCVLQTLAETVQDVDVERVAEIAEDQRNDVGALGGEAAGDRVGNVVELVRRIEHALCASLQLMLVPGLKARDTDACETPARAATSNEVDRDPGRAIDNPSCAELECACSDPRLASA